MCVWRRKHNTNKICTYVCISMYFRVRSSWSLCTPVTGVFNTLKEVKYFRKTLHVQQGPEYTYACCSSRKFNIFQECTQKLMDLTLKWIWLLLKFKNTLLFYIGTIFVLYWHKNLRKRNFLMFKRRKFIIEKNKW